DHVHGRLLRVPVRTATGKTAVRQVTTRSHLDEGGVIHPAAVAWAAQAGRPAGRAGAGAPNCHQARGCSTRRLPVWDEIFSSSSALGIGLANRKPWPTCTPRPCSLWLSW